MIDFYLEWSDPSSSYRSFKPIIIDQYTISIQASRLHACYPQVNNLSSEHYHDFEVAIIKPNGCCIKANTDPLLKTFEWSTYWESDDGYQEVGCHVPRSQIVQMLKDIERISKLKSFV